MVCRTAGKITRVLQDDAIDRTKAIAVDAEGFLYTVSTTGNMIYKADMKSGQSIRRLSTFLTSCC
jgi:hypothetical protein